MQIANILVPTLSLLLIVVFIHQWLWSKGGERRHVRVGAVGTLIGVVLVPFVVIRGMHVEHEGALYALHLACGGVFFVGFFWTVLMGLVAHRSKDETPAVLHRVGALCTTVALVCTLIVGLISHLG